MPRPISCLSCGSVKLRKRSKSVDSSCCLFRHISYISSPIHSIPLSIFILSSTHFHFPLSLHLISASQGKIHCRATQDFAKGNVDRLHLPYTPQATQPCIPTSEPGRAPGIYQESLPALKAWKETLIGITPRNFLELMDLNGNSKGFFKS